jgi:Hsp70 protein
VKRIIGRSIAELAKSGEKLSTHKIDKKYLNKKMSADEIGMNCPNLERNTTPLEISSEILRHLVAEASAYLGGEIITKAVITVPAYFLPAQCDATIKAGTYDRTCSKTASQIMMLFNSTLDNLATLILLGAHPTAPLSFSLPNFRSTTFEFSLI